MRMSHFVCPACGHDWQLESQRGPFERFMDRMGDAGGYVFIAAIWLVFIGLFVGALAAVYVFVNRVAEGGGLYAVFVVLSIFGVLLAFGLWSRGAMQRALGQQEDDRTPRDHAGDHIDSARGRGIWRR
jgi:hypothetical protein